MKNIRQLKVSTLCLHYMIGKETQEGERLLLQEVMDYYLGVQGESVSNLVVATQVLEWMGRKEEAIAKLERFLQQFPSHWEGAKTMVMFLIRSNQFADAIKYAKRMVEFAPWQTESYDVLNYAATKSGDLLLAKFAADKGSQVFEKEKELFEDLRIFLDRLIAQDVKS